MSSGKERKEASAEKALETSFLLDQCAAIEIRCGDLYRYFATLFPDQPELETLWRKTALEEDHHAVQLQMLSRLRGDVVIGIKGDLAGVVAALGKLDNLCSQAKGRKISAVDSLKMAIKLEHYLSQYHADHIAVCDDDTMARLFELMMKCDLEHVAMLEKALDKLQKKKDLH